MADNFRTHTSAAVDLIDAALFSGDEFVANPVARVDLRRYLDRWHRQLSELALDDDASGIGLHRGLPPALAGSG
jgi:hypothetical protein